MTKLEIILILYVLGFLITAILAYVGIKKDNGTRGDYFVVLITSIFFWWIFLPISFYENYLKDFLNKKL